MSAALAWQQAPSPLPPNQPVARFAGHRAIEPRPPDPLPEWLGGPLRKLGPVLRPDPAVSWRARSTFNAAAIVRGDKIYLLFRAQDQTGTGKWYGTSRIGLAESDDGIHFTIHKEPVLVPTEAYERDGGCEDPRVVEVDGTYYMTYTAYHWVEKTADHPADHTARMALAVSRDLVHWEKKGLVFPGVTLPPLPAEWTKSGCILPHKIGGEYLMYFGELEMYLARSRDLVHWKLDPGGPVLRPREGYWDGIRTEGGPPPFLDGQGNIHLLYNGDAPPAGYQAGEAVFSGKDPRKILRRSSTPLLGVTEPWERTGQVGNVIFLEGLVRKGGKIFFYYGAADDKVAVAVAAEGKQK